MEHDDVDALRRNDAAWRLLCAEHAPLLISFLGRVFVDENVREISASALISRLDDVLYAINEGFDPPRYPRAAKAYLEEWASGSTPWLRRYYAADQDEPQYDALPAVEKAVTFVRSLERREFIGTESRLNTAFDLLRQIAHGTEGNPAKRLETLRAQREIIDQEIDRVEHGELAYLEASAVRDRFQQFASIARELLADFREVEANFRELDRELRATIAGWSGSKGELLDHLVADRGEIASSEQGISFAAFYDFILSSRRQAEFERLLETVTSMAELSGDVDQRIRRVHYDWLAAAERTQATVRVLSEQVRRFVDDAAWLENRRIIEILRSVQSVALALRDHECELAGVDLDAFAPAPVLPMERRLYEPRTSVPLDSDGPARSDAADAADATALFEQNHVDVELLVEHVRDALAQEPQVALADVVDRHPLDQGLAELVSYLALPADTVAAVVDDTDTDRVHWLGDDDTERVAQLPRVTFLRRRPEGGP